MNLFLTHDAVDRYDTADSISTGRMFSTSRTLPDIEEVGHVLMGGASALDVWVWPRLPCHLVGTIPHVQLRAHIFKVEHTCTCIKVWPLQAVSEWSTDYYCEGLASQQSFDSASSGADSCVPFVESGCRWAPLESAPHVPSPSGR